MMEEIPKDRLYGMLASGRMNTGCPQLRFRDVCKRDMKALQMDPDHWEALAADRAQVEKLPEDITEDW